MSRRLGEYVPLSVDYADDDAVMSVTPTAELLFVRCICAARRLRSDGYLTDAQLVYRAAVRLGPPRRARALATELVSAGLLERQDGGFVIRSWLKWNKSADELGRERARDRDRKRADREIPESVQADTDRNPGRHAAESEGNPDLSKRNPATRGATRVARAPGSYRTVPHRTEPQPTTAEAVNSNVEGAQPGDELLCECGAILDPDGTCFACRIPQAAKKAAK